MMSNLVDRPQRGLHEGRETNPPATDDESADVIVVGAGAGGMTAAAVAAARGQRVILLEQSHWVGGTTAVSGGMVWIPANHKMAAQGLADSLEEARRYLSHVVPTDQHAQTLETYLTRGDEAIRFLEDNTSVRLQPVLRYPDYHPDMPGSTPGGRVLEPVPFDGSVLGSAFAMLRPPLAEFMLFGGMMIARPDIPHFRRVGRSLRSVWHVTRLLARHARERLKHPRGTTLVLGNALAGRLFKSVLDLRVKLRTSTTVQSLRMEGGRVTGVEVSTDGGKTTTLLRASRAVILATGGLSHSGPLRERFVPPLAGALTATMGSEEVPCGASIALSVGARLGDSPTRQGLWTPASTFTRADGSRGVYPHTVADRAKPGLIAVNQHGRRFVNEAISYHEFVRAQLAQEAVPAWLICDRVFLWRYGLGRVKPFALRLQSHLASGYLRRAPTLEALAQALNLPVQDFLDTVRKFNDDARQGIDSQFGRGADIYQRHLGDVDQSPNPCVAPIEHGPFYAVEVRPADIGMAAGLVTDTSARVLASDGAPIAGLYACGNDMQSVMNGSYPGPGITLGPALVFGYLAATHACAAPAVA